jgi:hypothetical protein
MRARLAGLVSLAIGAFVVLLSLVFAWAQQ